MAKKKEQCRAFPGRLQAARKENGLTQEGLAELLGVDTRTVNSWEQQTEDLRSGAKAWREPGLAETARLAGALHVTADFLLGLDQNENSPLHDVARSIGVSQIAAKKLNEYASKQEGGRNLPLNAVICDPCFGSLLDDLFLLKLAAENLRLAPLAHERAVSDKIMEKTLTGSSYVEYLREALIKSFDRMVRRLTRYDEAIEAHEYAVRERIVQKLHAFESEGNEKEDE